MLVCPTLIKCPRWVGLLIGAAPLFEATSNTQATTSKVAIIKAKVIKASLLLFSANRRRAATTTATMTVAVMTAVLTMVVVAGAAATRPLFWSVSAGLATI
jgi:hypothetical protein